MADVGRRRGNNNNVVSSLQLYATEKNGPEDVEFESCSLSDAGLIAIGEGFPKLEKLSLIWCSNVSSSGLIALAKKCSFFTALDLQGCYVGDHGLAAVGQSCKQLGDLNLRFCEALTDAGLVELALGCGNSLKALGIAPCAKITDVSLEAVGVHCKSLETLSLDSEFILVLLFLVSQGCIGLLCDHLNCPNARILTVCLEGLENILKVGEADKEMGLNGGVNIYDKAIDECERLDKIENLQNHDNHEIYEKAVKILERYWAEEEDEEQNI
ncbi:F-box/LRR-repeat protein 4-like [Humulus lupulus]|uniref:F-box/LRR-repeat protein 4-like n=1 Tax=Humulus lupulus TaxID=3486 RepID=UPI002B414C4D|nr:F-box/LRR-repeat protein 4-like [Humulus lupulus]